MGEEEENGIAFVTDLYLLVSDRSDEYEGTTYRAGNDEIAGKSCREESDDAHMQACIQDGDSGPSTSPHELNVLI